MSNKRNRVNKPRSCTQCGSKRIAKILYGMPAFSDELEQDIESGKIVLGGCVVTDDDPIWECVDCGKAFSNSARETGWSKNIGGGTVRNF